MIRLIVDNGNTQCKSYLFRGEQLLEWQAHNQADRAPMLRLISQYGPEAGILSSVGEGSEELEEFLQTQLPKLLRLRHTTPLPIGNAYGSPHTLGIDRIAAAVGAWQRALGQHCLVIDMGTAITIDYVDAAGVYRGGNISPGIRTRFRALQQFTARLPLVEPQEAWPEFGTDTHSALLAGVQNGVHYEIAGYMQDYQQRYTTLTVFLTGGEAFFFAQKFKNSIFAPELVAEGLNAILAFNENKPQPTY